MTVVHDRSPSHKSKRSDFDDCLRSSNAAISRFMGRGRNIGRTPDLFSNEGSGDTTSEQVSDNREQSQPRSILPHDLPTTVKQLADEELDRLLRVTIEEARRRGRVIGQEAARTKTRSRVSEPKIQSSADAAAPLTQGRIKAVRAASKAGITPSRIARQFGLSQSEVRKAMAEPDPE